MPRNGEFHKLHILQQTLDLHVCCSQCCERKTAITFSLKKLSHECSKNILLARQKNDNKLWKLVNPRPDFPIPERYVVCKYYTEEVGCTLHKSKCRFARSTEEAEVWNFMKKEFLEQSSIIKFLSGSVASPNKQDHIKHILSGFQGAFVELCETCFLDSPQKISPMVSDTCESKQSSFPVPVLVFRSNDKQKRVIYYEIRPLPKRTSQLSKLCRHVDKEEPCRDSQGCRFPHSEIEMAVWRLESSKKLDHSDLVLTARSHAALPDQKKYFYCRLCKLQFLEYEDFMNHCFSMEHRRLVFDDSASKWKYRELPSTSKALKICQR